MDELKALLKRFWKADAFFAKAMPADAEKQIENYNKLLVAIRDEINRLNIPPEQLEIMIQEAKI